MKFRSVLFLACLIVASGVLPSAFLAAPRSASTPMLRPDVAQAETPKAMFAHPVLYSTIDAELDAIAAVDVNGDGKLDLA